MSTLVCLPPRRVVALRKPTMGHKRDYHGALEWVMHMLRHSTNRLVKSEAVAVDKLGVEAAN